MNSLKHMHVIGKKKCWYTQESPLSYNTYSTTAYEVIVSIHIINSFTFYKIIYFFKILL